MPTPFPVVFSEKDVSNLLVCLVPKSSSIQVSEWTALNWSAVLVGPMSVSCIMQTLLMVSPEVANLLNSTFAVQSISPSNTRLAESSGARSSAPSITTFGGSFFY